MAIDDRHPTARLSASELLSPWLVVTAALEATGCTWAPEVVRLGIYALIDRTVASMREHGATPDRIAMLRELEDALAKMPAP